MNNEQILDLAKKNGAFQFDDIVGGICRNTEFHFTESELAAFAKELMQIQREELEWAIHQFRAIRLYTKDGAIEKACAEGETRLAEAIRKGGE